MSKLVAGKQYDVLDNHADKFVKPVKEFQPRIKNTNSTSHLAQKSSYYQPPRRRRSNNMSVTSSNINLKETLDDKNQAKDNKKSINESQEIVDDNDEEIEIEDDDDFDKSKNIFLRNRRSLNKQLIENQPTARFLLKIILLFYLLKIFF